MGVRRKGGEEKIRSETSLVKILLCYINTTVIIERI